MSGARAGREPRRGDRRDERNAVRRKHCRRLDRAARPRRPKLRGGARQNLHCPLIPKRRRLPTLARRKQVICRALVGGAGTASRPSRPRSVRWRAFDDQLHRGAGRPTVRQRLVHPGHGSGAAAADDERRESDRDPHASTQNAIDMCRSRAPVTSCGTVGNRAAPGCALWVILSDQG